jgi:ribosome-binding protein aMBF1 (putative translation factor)
MTKFITNAELHQRLMRKPGFKEAYDELDLEFRLIEEILKVRTKQGVTQKALAQRMGTKQSAIARFESGRANPTLDFIQRLARALDLKLHVSMR